MIGLSSIGVMASGVSVLTTPRLKALSTIEAMAILALRANIVRSRKTSPSFPNFVPNAGSSKFTPVGPQVRRNDVKTNDFVREGWLMTRLKRLGAILLKHELVFDILRQCKDSQNEHRQ